MCRGNPPRQKRPEGMAAPPAGMADNLRVIKGIVPKPRTRAALQKRTPPKMSCPHCGHRMAITSVAPARYANGAESNDLEDVTYSCVHCGATLISTRRSFSGNFHAVAHQV
jgi:DNA-directed RNA polymerase subunit RPC12/RpoP